MEKRYIKVMFTKNGQGFNNYRISLPTTWINDFNLTEDNRHVYLYKLSDKIIISREEIKMDEKLVVTQVIEECKKEMERTGFICNSDNTERFTDSEIKKAIESLSNEDNLEDNIEDYFDEISEEVNDYLKSNYKEVGYCKENADYVGYFYNNKYEFKDVETLEKEFGIGE